MKDLYEVYDSLLFLRSPPSDSGSGSEEDMFYRDYRAHQRSSFLFSETARREEVVRWEMAVWRDLMRDKCRLIGGGGDTEDDDDDDEGFWIDMHDLSRENVFVDESDWGKIVSRFCLFFFYLPGDSWQSGIVAFRSLYS